MNAGGVAWKEDFWFQRAPNLIGSMPGWLILDVMDDIGQVPFTERENTIFRLPGKSDLTTCSLIHQMACGTLEAASSI